jgi:hypothetical protein
MNVFDPVWSNVTTTKDKLKLETVAQKSFLLANLWNILFPCKQMFHTKWCTPMLKGQPPTFRNGKCSRCGVNERRTGGRYCLECHRSYTRAHRGAQKQNPNQLDNSAQASLGQEIAAGNADCSRWLNCAPLRIEQQTRSSLKRTPAVSSVLFRLTPGGLQS